MIEIIGRILLIIIGIYFVCMIIDELKTNYQIRKYDEEIIGGNKNEKK